jgi:hypothetical protein
MLLPGRVADDAREPSVERVDTERWIWNTGMHDFANQPTKELREEICAVPLSE